MYFHIAQTVGSRSTALLTERTLCNCMLVAWYEHETTQVMPDRSEQAVVHDAEPLTPMMMCWLITSAQIHGIHQGTFGQGSAEEKVKLK